MDSFATSLIETLRDTTPTASLVAESTSLQPDGTVVTGTFTAHFAAVIRLRPWTATRNDLAVVAVAAGRTTFVARFDITIGAGQSSSKRNGLCDCFGRQCRHCCCTTGLVVLSAVLSLASLADVAFHTEFSRCTTNTD